MTVTLRRNWWALLIRGIVAVVLGLLLIFVPGITLAAGGLSLALLFSLYAIIGGGSMVVSAATRREGQWLLWVILGVIGVIAGIITLAHPIFSALITIAIMVNIIGIFAIINGVMEIIVAWRIRREIDDEWFMILSGSLSVIFGVIVLLRPAEALEALLLILGFFALIDGALQIALAFRVRRMMDTTPPAGPTPTVS